MDPIANEDEETIALKSEMLEFINKTFDKMLTMHDFRVVKGNTHTNIIFDVVVPFDSKLTDGEIKEKIDS